MSLEIFNGKIVKSIFEINDGDGYRVLFSDNTYIDFMAVPIGDKNSYVYYEKGINNIE